MDVPIDRVNTVLIKHNNEKKALISILQDIQAEYNYLPQDALRIVSRGLRVPLIDIVGVATFYRAFSLTPRGKHTALVCLGTACHVRGGHAVLDEFERRLGVKAGDTTPDNQVTLETVACLGCCAIGPVVQIDGEYHGHTTHGKVGAILKKYVKPARTGKPQRAAVRAKRRVPAAARPLLRKSRGGKKTMGTRKVR
jgi:NADH:ubiquinone oxidoreductase subunit E